MTSLRSRMGLIYGLSLALSAAWLAALAAAPLLTARGAKSGGLIYVLFSPLCHQRPERCFALAGFPLAVCARCTGIYLGGFLGLLARPFLRPLSDLQPPRAAVFFAASLPVALDTAGNILGLWSSPGALRFATGLLWGSLLPSFWLAGLGSLFASRAKKN